MGENRLYAAISAADPDEIPEREPGDAWRHIASLALFKTADGLINPKLTLAWLLTALGAPAAAVGALVPIREAGALLPQLWLAPKIAISRRTKLWWAAGSALQGLAALAMAGVALAFAEGPAGWSVAALLALFALARAICSISHKDALARTIGKSRRGSVTGLPASLASALVLAFAIGLSVGAPPLNVTTIALALASAGVFLIAAAAVFTGLREEPPKGLEQKERPRRLEIIETLRAHPQLRIFILARSLLTVTALAPPFILLAAGSGGFDAGLGELGPLLIASSLASILSAYVWGRLADRSSRMVLFLSAIGAAVVFAFAAALGGAVRELGGAVGLAGLIFAAQLAYEGVRAGRKLHVVDMAEDADRARFVAISNTAIGGVLALGGLFGLLAEWISASGVLWVFAAAAALGAPMALALEEVQRRPRDPE